MDLDFTEEQQMVIDMTRTMLEEHCDTQVVRDAEDDPKGYPDALWKQMSELGRTACSFQRATAAANRRFSKAPSSTKSSDAQWLRRRTSCPAS